MIRPLTWSINQPITCGVWGDIFTLMLGKNRAEGLDFDRTATLHYAHTYFNASLIGSIFKRLGLPPESLEFLTLGASFGNRDDLETAMKADGTEGLLKFLKENPDGEPILKQLHDIVDKYGYLSETATDIAVSTWRENPKPAHKLFAQFVQNSPNPTEPPDHQGWLARPVQRRIQLKGQVATLYNRILAELRRSFLALAHQWQEAGRLEQPQDIFLLIWEEIQQAIQHQTDWEALRQRIHQRQKELQAYQDLPEVPKIVYGDQAPDPDSLATEISATEGQLQGIGASAGQVEGRIKVVHDWQSLPEIDQETILTVPYTDAGWAPLLAQAGGLISEVGGRLSHGAIVAREYGIPAVMNLAQATQRLKNGQRVRLHGQSGRVELLEDDG